ncbi:NINE protein [Rhodoferax aquaticus]|uniref:TM2 domain-containing protein n=1 Tax=Rhodoferax aquaticus TaxID=2527691 RepID=A0A515ERS6_9BURK|nr:NINE protein [Rhodoferax aquaticus]QDL55377.1 TM2 domain-containing protein [Rhodoferax aquaticus]
MKNKTIATWLAFLGGPVGLHRFYLNGGKDRLGWLLYIPTLLGAYGIWRSKAFGLDDPLIWLLIPPLGFTIAGCALNGIVFGLMSTAKWNHRFNPQSTADAPSGQTNWFTIIGVVACLFVGTSVLMASFAFTFQRYFEYQVEAAQQDAGPAAPKTTAN